MVLKYMARKKKFVYVVLFVLVVVFVILRMEEDSWICVDGKWEKHGFPYASTPNHQCSWIDNLNPLK